MKKRPKSASGADPEDPDEGTRRELLALLAQGADGVERFNARYKEALALAPFRRARCAGLDLASARLVSMPEGRFTKASLQGASLDRQDFGRANFVEADLRNASLIGARLVRADFTRANLEGARLDGASLQGANLTDASLKDAVLEGTSHNEATVWPSSFKLPSGLRWTGDGPDPIALARIDRAKSRRKPVDLPQFMKLLGKSIEGPRLAKALTMLKGERFRLFAETSDERLAGIVKSQSGEDLVYSCSLASDGSFACCTQNLNVCGGLRGALCKHLLVLVIGLAQANEISPDVLDLWIQRSALQKPSLNRDAQSEVLLRYKGVEAGEIDWRPTETVPEDFYTL